MEITEQELEELRAAKNDQQWNEAIDKIKANRDGSYPPDWYRKVIMGGINPNIDLGIISIVYNHLKRFFIAQRIE